MGVVGELVRRMGRAHPPAGAPGRGRADVVTAAEVRLLYAELLG